MDLVDLLRTTAADQPNRPALELMRAADEILILRSKLSSLTTERDQAKYGEQDMEKQRDDALLRLEEITKAGWRACIDHIIRPDSPCPVCRLEAALDERRAQAAVIKDLEASNTDLIIEANEAKGRLDDALMRLREAVAWFDVVKSKHDTVALIHLADDWPNYWLKITRDLLVP